MSSLVSEFIINPVLRQARRFSEISRATLAGDDGRESAPAAPAAVSDAAVSDAAVSDAAARPARDSAPHPGAAAPPQTPRSRALGTSTEETRVGDAAASPEALDHGPRGHLGLPSPRKDRSIPEDDGMRQLRTRIQAINARDIPSSEKARLMHEVLLEGYRASQLASRGTAIPDDGEPAGQAWEPPAAARPLDSLKFWHGQLSESSAVDTFVLTESDLAPTYAPTRQPKSPGYETPTRAPTPPAPGPPLGCQHYERNVKLQCSTCHRWYTCRFCHDAHEDHNLIRKETKHMLCMLCGRAQKASDVCVNCGETAAQYYCSICKLWENRQSKPIYHCNDCGICRRGLGLGKDFFHCKTCRACITTSIQSSHKCIERSTDCDCPICGEYLFTSPRPVVFMACGHSIHKKCYEQHMKASYKCPICNKSLANMETQFRNLDVVIQSQPMPPEFRDTKATILCNDCSGKSTVPYHWLGLKCSICRSYNTVELQIHGEGGQDVRASTEMAESTAEASQSVPAGSRVGGARRRHSSHSADPPYRVLDRTARSLSPLGLGTDPHLPHVAADVDSEDDILGFWRGNQEDSSEQDGSEYELDDSDGAPDVDDDDDDDEIVLIGHR